MYLYEDERKELCTSIEDIALITGPSRHCKVSLFQDKYREFDYFCFVLSINSSAKKILDFISTNMEWLEEKKIILIYNSNKHLDIYSSVNKIKALLMNNIKYEDTFYLGEDKHENKKLKDKFIEFAAKIRAIMECDIKKYPDELLKNHIEAFLKEHNMCTLCTGSMDMIIGTPIEYMYEAGNIYIITEGGRKFINILKNDKVSAAVYNEYEGFAKLKGLQLKGKVEIISIDNPEYDRILEMKKLQPENVKNLNMIMNILRIKLERADFLCSEIKTKGYDAKQIYEW